MSFFNNLRLKVKLYLSFIFILFLFIVSVIIALNSLISTNSVASNVNVFVEQQYNSIIKASQAVQNFNGQMLFYLSPGNQTSENKTTLEKDLELAANAVNYLDKNYPTAETKKIVSLFNEYVDHYQTVLNPLIVNRMPYDALSFYLSTMQNVVVQLTATFEMETGQVLNDIKLNVDALLDKSSIISILVVTVIAVIFSLGVATFISGYVNREITNLCVAADNIAKNNLNVNIGNYAKDEFGRLAKAMRTMRDDLSNTISLVVNSAKNLQQHLDEMHSLSDKVVNFSKQAESQAITVAAASDEMVSTTADIAKNCESAASLSERSKMIANDGMQLVRASVNEIKEQTLRNQEDGKKIQLLAEETDKIGSIVSTIDDIASQTNLLALNAAIEAARAGEYGRGFAVVADEVRALASRTTKSTQEISSMVLKIQTDTKEATKSMSESVKSMEMVANKAGEIENTLSDVVTQVNNVNGQITHIATAAEQQTTATSEISTNMQHITQGTQDIVTASDSAIEKARSSVDAINELLQDLSRFTLHQR